MFVFVVNTRAQHACCAVSFWWFHLRRWLLGGNTYAQLLGSSQRLNGHHTARGGVSNIEPLTRVQEETPVQYRPIPKAELGPDTHPNMLRTPSSNFQFLVK